MRVAHQWWLGALAAGAVLCVWPVFAQAEEVRAKQALLNEGKLLFLKHWEAGQPATPGGDGLGPMFNAVSCDACHNQGGAGGGGSIDFNVDMLSRVIDSSRDISEKLKEVHPAFVSADGLLSNITLHRFGTSPKYGALRQLLTGVPVPIGLLDQEREELQRKVAQTPLRSIKAPNDLSFVLSQRQTPALFGAGLIDAIPDETLRKLAATQPVKFPGISGRVAQVRIQKIGRFGWRGQTEHLADFVLGACANELGLQVPDNQQPMDPTRPDYKPVALDLTQTQCDRLTAYVASLASPKLVEPKDSEKARVADFGRTVFQQIGCSACHVETVGPATGIYSDLLLHDMGPALADPVFAQSEFVLTDQAIVDTFGPQPISTILRVGVDNDNRPARTYYGGNVAIPVPFVNTFTQLSETKALRKTFTHNPTEIAQEWRTPPLWGVANSAPYLHDGRAATLLEAIVLHGGEAKATTGRFLQLPTTERLALLEFLNCLKSP